MHDLFPQSQILLTISSHCMLLFSNQGFSRKEAIGKPLVKTFIVESLKSSVHEIMDNALNGKETSNYELEFQTKGRKIRYLLVNATTRRDAEGNIVGVVGVAQDVTEAAQHDRAVAAMANELRQLVDTANAPIFGIDVHGRVNEWNDKTAEITVSSNARNFYFIDIFISRYTSLIQSGVLKGRGAR